jgi:uncharacterized SAM-binding protein YcdF (DUF218 family)
MMGRVVTAARLHRRLGLPIIVTGGRPSDNSGVTEASVVRRFLEDLGVPGEMIIEENRARDTMENARYSMMICRQRGFSQPIVLTSAYHLRRAQMAFTAAGAQVTLFPAYFIGAREGSYRLVDWLPWAGALHVVSDALHEYVGMLFYRLAIA